MKAPPLGPDGEDITWPDQVAPRGRGAPSTGKLKPQISNHVPMFPWNLCVHLCAFALMVPGVKRVEITISKASNVSMLFVCAFDSPSRLKTAGKVENSIALRQCTSERG